MKSREHCDGGKGWGLGRYYFNSCGRKSKGRCQAGIRTGHCFPCTAIGPVLLPSLVLNKQPLGSDLRKHFCSRKHALSRACTLLCPLNIAQEAELGKLTSQWLLSKSCTLEVGVCVCVEIKTVINKFLPHGPLELEEKKSFTELCLPYNDFENNKKNWS